MRDRVIASFAATGVAAAAALMLVGSASPRPFATYTVRVAARDFSFALTRSSVPAGSTVQLVVRNRGAAKHRLVINGKRTRVLSPGTSQTVTVRFSRQGAFRFLCTVADHAKRGMRGTFRVTAAAPAAPAPPAEPPLDVAGSAVLTRIGTFERPVLVTAPAGDDRLYVVEQTGAVRVVQSGEVLPEPFLDLRGRVTSSGESGLLSIAFAPDYATSGLLYAFLNLPGGYGDTRIAEFRRHPDDPNRTDPNHERALLTIPKPYENHNGGMLQFGPDGFLYASFGDGDPGVVNPPGFFAQRLDSLLGRLIRIDPRSGDPYTVPGDNPFVGFEGARPETWAYGLRNPWRFWIDHETGTMFVPDVGSTSREEVNVVAPGRSGLNFGWPCFEGTLVFDTTATCDLPVAPLIEFPRDNGVCAIIGGVVVRDSRIRALGGRYLYGDLCSGKITAVAISGGRVTSSVELDVEVPGLSSFGVDGAGRVYVTAIGGEVARLDPARAG
jgi:glucose/arabinose dehydrogenase